MALTFIENDKMDLTPRITVFGVGGAGGNAVNNMIEQNLEGVEFVVANTDAQALQQSKARSRIQLGVKVTEGLGAGARPTVGASAAEETLEEIIDHLAGAHMCFITAGMGGGTGTGAAPIIAQAARELGVLTVGVVTKPFAFEGAKRMRQAEEGVEALQKVVDTLIIIPNQNLFRLANERTTFTEAFAMADDVLYQGVKGVTDLMVRPGMINLDFADVRAVMDEMGKAMMGTGEASGEDRARQAAEKAIANPLLDEISLHGARGVLINITGGNDLTLYELDEAANLIREKVDPEANIIVGSTLDLTMEGSIRVSVVATGIEAAHDAQSLDVQRRRLAEPLAAHPADVPAAQPEPEHGYEPEQYHEPEAEPAPLFEPRREAARAEPQRDMHADARQHAYAPAAHSAPQQARPAYQAQQPQQDEFDLDDVLGTEAATPRPTVVLNTPRQNPAPQAQQQPQPRIDEATQFTAPQRERVAGQPSAETLARLRNAVLKQPEAPESRHDDRYHDPRQAARQEPRYEPRPAQPQQRMEPQPQPQPQPRRGLGGLIHRMAGSHAEAPAPSARVQPPVHAYDDEPQQRASQDRIEIPAFLRRQAN
ncbi:cell division protein FtsZ [Pararhodobacter sp.]|uniref:cell division protein FtsZ n=1 Tax=Pararhodobacter sp. TaxID=2127056 RepID=UPI002AFF4435|nr:cell division protein FtsZ [Pararhodobacter sp.]